MSFIHRGGESSIYDLKGDIMKVNYSPSDYKEIHQGIINTSEIYFLKMLNHPNIIKMKHLARNKNVKGMEDNVLYILPKYPFTLTEFIKMFDIPKHTSSFIMVECLKALSYLHHNNIIHGDIKPSNILIDPETFGVVLIDFGHAQYDEDQRHEITGTEFYQAPEVNKGSYNKSIDIYSMGKTFFELNSTFEELIGHMIIEEPSLRWTADQCLKHLDVDYKPDTIDFDFKEVDVDFDVEPKVFKYACDLHHRTNSDFKVCYYIMLKTIMLGKYNPPPFKFPQSLFEKEMNLLSNL